MILSLVLPWKIPNLSVAGVDTAATSYALAFQPTSCAHRVPIALKPRQTGVGHGAATALGAVRFARPLLESGYKPAVLEHREGDIDSKPLLLYLPGFDGTLVAPFIQFPELGTEFDLWGMEVPMDDRSTFEELKEIVIHHIEEIMRGEDDGRMGNRPLYLMGESFGGTLALEVSRALRSAGALNLRGLILVNPATCYDRSALVEQGPIVADLPFLRYPLGVVGLLPLFTDEYSLPQLGMILSSEGLPSVIDTAAREAYMGRTALSLPQKLNFMPKDTLQWRLTEWLITGCKDINEKAADGRLVQDLGDLPILILAGECDKTLPSVQEASRLSEEVLRNSKVVIVDGAGHASTLGSRVDLTAEMRAWFSDLQSRGGRTAMKEIGSNGLGKYRGMESRYDGAWIGLNPLLYWSKEYYHEWTK